MEEKMIDLPPEPPAIIDTSYNNIERKKIVIKLEYEDKIYTINEDYKLSPTNESLNKMLKNAIDEYGYPSQGFKTGFVVQQLKNYGIKIIEFYDKEMEEAPDGVVY